MILLKIDCKIKRPDGQATSWKIVKFCSSSEIGFTLTKREICFNLTDLTTKQQQICKR